RKKQMGLRNESAMAALAWAVGAWRIAVLFVIPAQAGIAYKTDEMLKQVQHDIGGVNNSSLEEGN
ncbi:hypothetical protein, partial [Ornithobacterium rhinotracheale]